MCQNINSRRQQTEILTVESIHLSRRKKNLLETESSSSRIKLPEISTSTDESDLSKSPSDSLTISDGSSNIAKQNFYKGPSPPLSKASRSNSISSSKISYQSSNIRVTSDEENIFIQKKDTAMGIETLKVEKEKIYEEILLMEDNLKIPRHFQEIQEKLEMPTNFEEIAENLKMHLDIYNLYIERINYLSLED